MKWLDHIRSGCGLWQWYQRRKAMRILRHARFYADKNYDAVHILIDAQFKVIGVKACSR